MMRVGVLSLLLAATPALAQQPYAGQQSREVKSLSAEEVQQYLAGAGMGYAKPAELSSYPGPMHVLELADKLALTLEQRARTKILLDEHKAQARALGIKRVEAEQALDEFFASKRMDEAALAQAVRAAAALEGEYRLSHLETHRRMRALLTEEQVIRYNHLRGYGSGTGHGHGMKH
jgi:Spy/CpxP family protein refolding chaperone